MISSRHILICLLASSVITEPMTAIPSNRFRSAYKTIHSDIRCLFGGEKIDDPEQRKRIIIEVVTGIAIMLITGTAIWIWWVRPLQKQLRNQGDDREEDEVLHNTPKVNASSSLQHLFRHGDETFLNNLIDQSSEEELAQVDEYGNTVLHYAASRDISGIVMKLLTKKLDSNKKNLTGETPLHFAAFSNQKDVVKILITKGADPTIENKDKQTPHLVASDPIIQEILKQAEREWTKKG